MYGNRKDPEGYGQQEYRLIVGSDKGGENGGIVRMINIKERRRMMLLYINAMMDLHDL